MTRPARVLQSIIETEISPELVPGEERAAQPTQVSETTIGPFELQDFFLYYISRSVIDRARVMFLAEHAWRGRSAGDWPEDVPPEGRAEYDRGVIKRWFDRVPPPILRDEPIQEVCVTERAKGGLGRFVSPRERLACTQRQSCGRVAAGARARSAGSVERVEKDGLLTHGLRRASGIPRYRRTRTLGIGLACSTTPRPSSA